MTTAAEGSTKIVYADARFLALVDRATEGAASDFIATCRPTLEAIRGDAMARWPVKTGKSRDAFRLNSSISPTEVRANLVNTSGYAYYVRYSKWTAADIHTYVREKSAEGTNPAALAPTIRRRMIAKHGKGAPSEAVAGKHAWTLTVQRPTKAALAELLPKLRASMGRLAGAT
jgi:hypothetical protein